GDQGLDAGATAGSRAGFLFRVESYRNRRQAWHPARHNQDKNSNGLAASQRIAWAIGRKRIGRSMGANRMSAERRLEQVAETASLYAVGNLPDAEARKFELRIQSGCPYCTAELDDCQRAVEGLVSAQTAVAPPRGLEGRLFEKIGRGQETK